MSFTIPPRSTDQTCYLHLNEKSGFYQKLNIYYRAGETTSITVTPTANPFEFQIVENNLTNRDHVSVQFVLVDCMGQETDSVYDTTVTVVDTVTSTVVAAYLPAGNYHIRAVKDGYGFSLLDTDFVTVAWSPADPTLDAAITSSYTGGKSFSISGQGFVTDIIENNEVYVCGVKGKIISASASALTV